MSHTLPCSPEFFWGDGAVPLSDVRPSRRPRSVYQALVSLTPHEWASLANDVFHCPPDRLDREVVMRQILQTNSRRNLDTPVEVLIDPEGWYHVLVYDPQKE